MRDGGAESGGAGGLGGSGAFGGVTGGNGGQGGGSGGSSGVWGASPTWEPIPGTAVGCSFERMTNAASVRFFQWEPCSWTDGCDQAVFNESVFGQNATFIRTSIVVDDGTTVRAGLTMWSPKNIATVANDDGMGLDAIRVTGGKFDCRIAATSIWKQRFAIHVQDLNVKQFAGIVGDIGNMTTAPVVFTIPEPPPPGGTQQFVLGDERWLWWWTPGDRLSTVSATDGSDFQIFAKATLQGPVVEYSGPATTGALFLAEEFTLDDGGGIHARIAYSDGVSPTQAYLVPNDPNDDYGEPAFAHTHVGFMKGIGRKGLNLYDSVEIWATPYSTNPSELQPEKVGAFPYTSTSYLVGGWGHLGTGTKIPPNDELGLAVWSIAKKSALTYEVPKDRFQELLGVSHTHLWVGGRVGGDDPYLMRFKVE